MQAIRDYVSAHPYWVSAIIYPILTGLISGIFHARSSGEYANKPARVAALYKLVAAVGMDIEATVRAIAGIAFGPTPAARAKSFAALFAAVFIDPPKLLEALYQLITGTRREDDDSHPQTGGVAALAIVAMVLCVGCTPSLEVARDQARGVVLTVAKGVQQADIACAEIAFSSGNIKLARACADAYDVARDALLGAESAVDAWDAAHQNEVACAAVKAVASLTSMVSAIQGAGGKVPAVVTDALTLAPALAEVCRG